MNVERKGKISSKRTEILQDLYSKLVEKARFSSQSMLETLISKADMDGPMQSKQPDEMIKLEGTAAIFEKQAKVFGERAEEVEDMLRQDEERDGKIETGSIIVWDLSRGGEQASGEVVIITETGGGELGDYRLLSRKTPLADKLIGKTAGDTLEFADMTIDIREVF